MNRYDRQHDHFDYFPATNATGIHQHLANRTMPFFVDQHELFYLSDSEGLVRFDYRGNRKTTLAADLHVNKKYDLQNSPVMTASGNLWLQVSSGLMRYNLRSNTRTYYFSDRPDNHFGPPETVLTYYVDSDDQVWMGTKSGLIRFDYQRNTYQIYAPRAKHDQCD